MVLVKGIEKNRKGFEMIAACLDANWVFIISLWKFDLVLVKRPYTTWNGKKER